MTRRLRLALLVAALVAAGPMPSARVVELARTAVGIAWVRAEFPSRQHVQPRRTATAVASLTPLVFIAERRSPLPDAFRSHSLFQRPPPLQS